MGEVITPGCLAGSSGAVSVAGAGGSAGVGWRTGAAAAPWAWRATRTRWPSRSYSISLKPVSSSRRASSRIRSGSTAGFCLAGSLLLRSPVMASALAPRGDQRGQSVDRQRVAVDAEAAQARLGHRRDVGMVAKALAREDVADVDLDDGHSDRGDGVADGDRGVGIGAGVDDDPGGLLGARSVDRIDDLALVVRLQEFDLEGVAAGGLAAQLLHVLERGTAIGGGLARAEEVEVGAVEDVDGFRHGRSGTATRRRVSRFIGTSRAKGKPTPCVRGEGRPRPRPVRERGEARPRQRTRAWSWTWFSACGRVPAAATSSSEARLRVALQHVALPQRAALTFSLRVLRPTAPMTTSLPTT